MLTGTEMGMLLVAMAVLAAAALGGTWAVVVVGVAVAGSGAVLFPSTPVAAWRQEAMAAAAGMGVAGTGALTVGEGRAGMVVAGVAAGTGQTLMAAAEEEGTGTLWPTLSAFMKQV
jgi:hypothetical protein